MGEGFVTFRETLEAALVVGILARYAAPSLRSFIWAGVGSAVVLSIAGAWVLHRLASAHILWEIGLSFSAAGLLVSMVVWMQRRSGTLRQELQTAAQVTEGWLLFGTSLFAVLREGLETAIFLRALWQMQQSLSWVGGIVGLLVAVLLGLSLFLYGRRVPLRPFFRVTSVLLLLMAAGMAAYGAHELLELLSSHWAWAEALEEAKAWTLFPPTSGPPKAYAWAYTFHEGLYYPLLHHKGWLGGIFHALLGWRATMSWTELGVWLLTFGLGFWLWRKANR
ncbi:MAG: FTR1 family protein [Bacteroidia bacterium]|nr:FTR1 family protein [Bacteroidia bacterium]MDW8089069.1 FTR1 family protein [Bacteroidia bacterium]